MGPWLGLAGLVALALALRLTSSVRRRLGRPPRVIWGPEPVISIKYWSEALRSRGYESTTCVHGGYTIYVHGDFDRHRDEFMADSAYGGIFRDYAVLAWAMRHADVFMFYLDGGFLRWTRWRGLEAQLLRLAGRRLVVFPYGSDIAVPGHLGPAEEPLLRDYPQFAETSDAVRERVDYYCARADVVVRNYQFGYLPRYDVLWPTMLAIDTEEWSEAPRGDSGPGDEVVVVHAPNHRHIKGTDGLIQAIDELRAEGVPVRLSLLERRPNSEVREALLRSDIVADQFVAGYALFAIEGLATGKPVLSALSWMDSEVLDTESLRNCPIVDVNLETLADELRRLASDVELRAELGRAGRRFVLDYHSYDAVADGWEAILDHVWRGAPLPSELPVPSQPGEAARSAWRHSTTERRPSR